LSKSSAAEQVRRVNVTVSLLQRKTTSPQVLGRLVTRYGLSRRQAYRYLEQARRAHAPLAVPEPKAVFTVKLPKGLIWQVRQRARRERSSISLWVEQALRRWLSKPKGHG
jgi:predicted DNA-binding transcriptional regulator YafY